MFSSLAGVFSFYITFRRRAETKAALWLMILIISVVLWSVTYALFYLLPKGNAAIVFIELRYVFVMTSGWLVYIFVYRTLNHQMFPKRILLLFSLFPIVDLVLLLANRRTGIFIVYSGFIEVNGIRALTETNGPGFFYHCVLSYIPLLLAAVSVIGRFIRLPKKHGRLLGLIFSGLLIVFTMTLFAIFGLLPYPIDLAPFGAQVLLLIFCHALFNSKSMDMMFISRDIIFNNASSVILVLDTGGFIVDYNNQASDVAKRIHITDMIGMHRDAFMEIWRLSSQSYVFEEDPSIFSIVENEKDYHYQIQISEMTEKNGHVIGSYMEIKNISPIMSLIHMLQDAAYYDSLTGLPNRNYFNRKSAEIDKPESLPLCVIVGDVNGLKGVNDTYGHVKGDVLLKWISTVLLECAPKDGFIFRMGGDEYIGLFPHTTDQEAQEYIKRVDDRVVLNDDPELKSVSIALGFKIKTKADERIEDLMKAADYEMYTTKGNRRASSR